MCIAHAPDSDNPRILISVRVAQFQILRISDFFDHVNHFFERALELLKSQEALSFFTMSSLPFAL